MYWSIKFQFWIWEVSQMKLHSVIVHQSPILSTIWNPKSEKLTSLLILTNDGLLHVWTSKGALCLSLPPLDQDYQSICVQPILAQPHSLRTIDFPSTHVYFLKILPHPHPQISPRPRKQNALYDIHMWCQIKPKLVQ